MAQNIIAFGVDTSSFNEQKRAKLQEFITLFDKLSTYDGKNIAPVLGVGLVEFNNSISATNKLLDEMTVKLQSLSESTKGSSSTSSTAAKSTNELSLATNEYKKQADAAAIAQAKLSVLTSDQAKQTAALKLQLSETTKAILEEARANNVSIASRESAKKKSEEYRIEQKRVVDSLRAVAIEQDRVAATEAKLQNKVSRDEKAKQLREDRIAIRAFNQEQANTEKEAKNAEKALRDESLAAKALSSDYNILRQSLKDQGERYSNLFINKGKDAPETKAALAEYSATAGIINDIDKKLASAGGSSKLFGGALATAFGHLRNLAYILPGLGIAGIFNVAFEALGKLLEEFDLFSDKVVKVSEDNERLNNVIKQQIELFNNLNKSLASAYQSDTFKESNILEDILSSNKSRGFSKDKLLSTELDVLSGKLKDAKSNVDAFFGSESQITSYLDERANNITDLTGRLDALTKREEKYLDLIRRKDSGEKLSFQELDFLLTVKPEQDEARKKDVQSKLDTEKEKLKIGIDYSNKFVDIRRQQEDKIAEIEKFNEDEIRRQKLNNAKEEISLNEQTQDIILGNEISSEKQRIEAIQQLRKDAFKSNKADLDNVLNNISSTPKEREEAQFKYGIENKKAAQKAFDETADLVESYKQRRLKAITEVSKGEEEKTAITNERIYKNEEQSLDARLAAYNIYIQKKQNIQDLEYYKDINQQKFKANDKGVLDPTAKLELDEINQNRKLQKANIQADAEKQVYDIVYTSLQKQLKAVIDENYAETRENQKKYTKELEDLNELYRKRQITYISYVKRRRDLDEQYRVELLDEAIKDDEEDISRLKTRLDEEIKAQKEAQNEIEGAKVDLQHSKDTGEGEEFAQKRLNEAIGTEKAIGAVIVNTKKEIEKEENKLDDDKLKRAKANFDKLKDVYRTYYQEIKELTDSLYALIKQSVDSVYEKELERLKLKKDLVDQVYGSEIAAIEKSSLTAKDKAALDKQLQAQKLQADKNAAVEERRIKKEQAIVDKELAIFNIAINTAEGISKAFATLEPPANLIEAGLIATQGSVQTAIVASKPIPYKKGTPPGGHPGGLAEYGEDGAELVKEPYKSPYLVMDRTISMLPKGTEVVPLIEPDFQVKKDDSWEQTKYLARQIAKSKKEIKNVFSPKIIIDLGQEQWKRKILGN